MPETPPDQQILELRRRFERDPKSPVFAELAEALVRAARAEEAAEVCHQGLLSNPEHLRGRLALAAAYREMGHYRDARAELTRIVRLDEHNARAHRLLGEVLLTLGDEERAEVVLQRAVDLAPEDGIARHLLRRLHGDPDLFSVNEEEDEETKELDVAHVGARVARPVEPVDPAAFTSSAQDRSARARPPDAIPPPAGPQATHQASADPEGVLFDLDRTQKDVPIPAAGRPQSDVVSTRVVDLPRSTARENLEDDTESFTRIPRTSEEGGPFVNDGTTEQEARRRAFPTFGLADYLDAEEATASGEALRSEVPVPADSPVLVDRHTEQVPKIARPGALGPIPDYEDSMSESSLDDETPTDLDPEIRMRLLGELWRAKLDQKVRPHTTSVSVKDTGGRPLRPAGTEALAVPAGKHALLTEDGRAVFSETSQELLISPSPVRGFEEEEAHTSPRLPDPISEADPLASPPSPFREAFPLLHPETDPDPTLLDHDDPFEDAEPPTNALGVDPLEGEPPTSEWGAPESDAPDFRDEPGREAFRGRDSDDRPRGIMGAPPADDHLASDLIDGVPPDDGGTVSLRPPLYGDPLPRSAAGMADDLPTTELEPSVSSLFAGSDKSDLYLLTPTPSGVPSLRSSGPVPLDEDYGEDLTNRWTPDSGPLEPGAPAADMLDSLMATLERSPSPRREEVYPYDDPLGDDAPVGADTAPRAQPQRAPRPLASPLRVGRHPAPAPAPSPDLMDGLSELVMLPNGGTHMRAIDPAGMQRRDDSHTGPDPLDVVLARHAQAGLTPRQATGGFRWGVAVAFLLAAGLVVAAGTILYLRHDAVERADRIRSALVRAEEAAAVDTWAGYLEALEYLDEVTSEDVDNEDVLARIAFFEAMIRLQFGADAMPDARLEESVDRLPGKARTSADAVFARAVLAAATGTPAALESALKEVDAAADAYSDEPAISYLRGRLLMRLGRTRDAREAVVEALDLDAAYVPALVAMGHLEADGGAASAAEERFADALALSEEHTAAAIGRYRVIEATGRDTTSAAADLQTLMAEGDGIAPTDRAWGNLCLARYHRRAGEPDRLEEILNRILDEPLEDVEYLRELASLTFVLRRLEDTNRYLDRALDLDVREARRVPLIHLKALVALESGDATAARKLLSSLTDESEAVGRYLRGRAALQSGELKEAATELNAARLADASLVVATVYLAKALLATGRSEEAEMLLTPLASDGEGAPVARSDPALDPVRYLSPGVLLAVLGNAQRKLKRYKVARVTLEEALTADPTNTEALFDLALLHGAVSEVARREELLDQVLRLAPDNSVARREMVLLLAGIGRYDDAVARLDGGISAGDARIASVLLEAALSEGDLVSSRKHLKTLRGAGASEPRLMLWHARVELLAGRGGEAQKIANAALKKLPRSAGLSTVVGDVLMMGGDPKAARKEYERALVVDSRYIPARLGLGDAWRAVGDTARALREYRAALAAATKKLTPRGFTGRAHLGLAYALAVRDEKEKALDRATSAVTLMPGSKEALTLHADLAAELKQVDAARASYEAALALDPTDVELRFRYASLLAGAGDRDGALREFADYLDRAPSGKNRVMAQRWIDRLEGK